ncbi:MAG: folate-binding protein [Pseudomonadales bacterium]
MSINEPLQAFFSSIGVSVDDQHHSQIDNSPDPNPVQPADNLIAPLTHYGLLAVNGPDSAKFLQGQTTCNLNEIDDHNSRPGSYCTPKGRMVTSFHIARSDSEHYYLRMHRSLVASSKAVLAKYIVFSNAEQTIANNDYLIVGIYGDKAAASISQSFGTRPTNLNGSVTSGGNIAIQRDEASKCYECWIQSTEIATLWPKLSEGLILQGSKTWELLMIRSGQGEVTEATVEMFIPQMLNYHITGAVNFTKGCYTGQEIVARMQYRGKLKRRMYRIQVETTALGPGTNLYTPDREQSVGNIVNAVSTGESLTEALAVITIKEADANSLIQLNDGSPIQILSLPYAITNND